MVQSCTILPGVTAAFILSYPGHTAKVPMMLWLQRIGIRPDNIVSLSQRFHNQICAYNSVVKLALRTRNPCFIFADNDVNPTEKTTPFVSLMADVISCRYQGEKSLEEQWSEPTAFHTALWACRRKVLETIKPPWFEWTMTPDGCNITECLCNSFRRKVLDAGFSIEWGGFAGHEPKART